MNVNAIGTQTVEQMDQKCNVIHDMFTSTYLLLMG